MSKKKKTDADRRLFQEIGAAPAGSETNPLGGDKPENTKKKKIMKYAKYIFLILVVVFLIRYFYNNYDTYKNLEGRYQLGYFRGRSLVLFLV